MNSTIIKILTPFAAFLLVIIALRVAIDLLMPMLPWLCPLAVLAGAAGLYLAWRRRSW